MVIEVNETILKQHEIAIEQVTARQHSAHGLVERRMKDFGDMIGKLDVKQSNMTKTEASNFTRVIAAKLNERPYGLRFANTDATGPLHPGQDLQMEAICPNHWKISHRVKGVTAAFVHLPAALAEHQAQVQDQLELLATFHDQKILCQCL